MNLLKFRRDFIFLFKKITTILIISFVKVGDAPVSYQNNAFFILILNIFFFGIEFKCMPFGIPQLNSFNSVANIMMIFTIFGGLFSSINQQTDLPIFIMISTVGINIYFLLLFFRNFIMIKISLNQGATNFFVFNFLGKMWESGK